MGLFDFIDQAQNEAVGIDIGTSAIKAVHLDISNRPTFKNFAIARLKKGSIQTSNQIIAGKQISNILSFALAKSNIKCKSASFSVPNFSTFISFVTIPKVDKEQLPARLEQEAKKFIPVPLSEVSLGWEIIRDRNQKKFLEMNSGGKTMKILIMAISNDTISKYETIAKGSKLNLTSIEAETMSLIRCLIGGADRKNTILILDIGSRICNILVVSRGYLKGSRNIDVGGGDITKAISRSLGVDMVRSEALKKEGGLEDSRIKDLIKPVLGRIAQESKRMIQTYNQKNPNNPVQKVLSAGGTAKLKGFEAFLKQELSLPIHPGDPWSQINFSSEQEPILRSFQDELAVSIGSALNGYKS
ncbi:MAG: type IV pilus assembly protein PilM [Candidatus Moranbacteria bacterium]|nr:type IV pilus assembly protein PilM [Candidatus Moranbacteria bacterium]